MTALALYTFALTDFVMGTGAMVQLPVFDGGAGRGVSGDARCSHSFAYQVARRCHQIDMSS